MTQDFNISIHALLFLKHKGDVRTSEQIAEKVCTNPVVIRRIMGALKRAGLVTTREGIHGGYQIREEGGEITLCEVKKALAVRPFKRTPARHVDEDCLLSSGMGDLLDRLYEGMDEACDRYLTEITIGMLEKEIFERRPAKAGLRS